MKTKTKQELHTRTLQTLKTKLKEARDALYLLRIDKSLGKLKNPRSIFWKKKEVAQMLSLIREKELENAKNI